MADDTPVEDLEFSDAELIEILKNHGFDRRSVMKGLGLGAAAVAFGSGPSSAKHEPQHPPGIDSHYGYAAPSNEPLPGNLRPDHEVGLHIHEEAIFDRDPPTTLPFHFEPMGLQIDVGDIVRFNFASPEHTVSAFHQDFGREQRVPNDVPPFSSPVINDGGFWLYEFDSPGTYDVFCAPHEPFGMVMRLVVGDPDDPQYDDTFEQTGRPPFSRAELTLLGVTEWPFSAPHAVFQTDALSVENIESASDGVSPSDVETDLFDLPIVTKLLPMEDSTGSNAEFDVAWEVTDQGGNLDELTLVLIDLDSSPPGPEGPPTVESVDGTTDDGTTTLTAPGDNGSGHQYLVQATVTDDDNSSSSAIPVTEDGSS